MWPECTFGDPKASFGKKTCHLATGPRIPLIIGQELVELSKISVFFFFMGRKGALQSKKRWVRTVFGPSVGVRADLRHGQGIATMDHIETRTYRWYCPQIMATLEKPWTALLNTDLRVFLYTNMVIYTINQLILLKRGYPCNPLVLCIWPSCCGRNRPIASQPKNMATSA